MSGTETANRARNAEWIANWIDAVCTGKATMSQRARSSIDARGGLNAVVEIARAKGVHLVELTDDKGQLLVAASRHPIRTLC